jgi:membrane protein implicated in regulation of membrane protease activity
MDLDRSMTRLFVVLGCILGALAAAASLLLHSWLPLAAVGVVMLCVMAITLSEAAIFAPLLALVLRAGEHNRKKKAKPSHSAAGQESGSQTAAKPDDRKW